MAKYILFLLALGCGLACGPGAECVGDCTFDLEVDIGILIYQPADFNGRRVRVRVPAHALRVQDDTLRIRLRDIERDVPIQEPGLRHIQTFATGTVYLYFTVNGRELTLTGIRRQKGEDKP